MRNRARIFLNSVSMNELHDQHRRLLPSFLRIHSHTRASHLVSTHARTHFGAHIGLELLTSTVSSWPVNFHERMSHFRKLRAIARRDENNRRDERLRSFVSVLSHTADGQLWFFFSTTRTTYRPRNFNTFSVQFQDAR